MTKKVSDKSSSLEAKHAFSRRNFLATSAATGVALAAVEKARAQDYGSDVAPAPTPIAAQSQIPDAASQVPFDSFRDHVLYMEKRGYMLRFERMDQDAYEITAVIYKLIDEFGWREAPGLIIEEIKMDGEWIKGPLVINHNGHWDIEPLTFGLEPVPHDGPATYRKTIAHLKEIIIANKGAYPEIPPVPVAKESAPCKEVILKGDEIDLTKFAFIKSNPSDVGRYINTPALFTKDPDMGVNFGTYRCQLRGPREIGVNPEANQTGWKMLMAAKERGEKEAPVTLVLGQDPMTWLVSSTRIPQRFGPIKPIDELAVAGGVRGKALEVTQTEDGEFTIPAHAEFVIEGRVQLESMKPEGPYGEMYGYLGPEKDENFWMIVDTVTHRKDPWFLNNFTGVTPGYLEAPEAALTQVGFKRLIPELVELYNPTEHAGVYFMSIDKTEAGQGLAAGEKVAKIVPIAKVVIVVDKDMDVMNMNDIMLALASRWQIATASKIYDSLRGMPLDPSLKNPPMTSKIVIDATKQLPEEGGPDTFAELNRTLFDQGAPGTMDQVMEKWGDVLKRRHAFGSSISET